MKKFKNLSFLMILLTLLLLVTSCDSNNNSTTTTPSSSPTQTPAKTDIDLSEIAYDSAGLMSITIDSSNAKTSYYVGDELDTSGLYVTARFVSFDADGNRITRDDVVSDKITIDTSEVNMYLPGTYPVIVTYRKDVQSRSSTYNINVYSDVLGTSGQKYVGGLQVSLTDKNNNPIDTVDTLLKSDYYFNPKFVVKYYASEKPYNNGADDFEVSMSDLKVEGLDKVDINTAGTYLVRFSYVGPTASVNGQTIENVVSTFVIFNVFDRVTKIEYYMGTTTYDASINDFTYNDWFFTVTREVSGNKTIKYKPETFTISGINQYVAGNQTATIVHNENGTSTTVPVTIKPSNNVLVLTNLTAGFDAYTNNGNAGTTAVVDHKGLVTAKFDKVATASAILNAEVSFNYKITIKETGYIDVKLEKAGTIIIYFTTTGTDARNLVYYNADGDTVAFVESPSETNKVAKLSISFDEAGTYRFNTESSGIYLYGVIVGYN